MDGKLRKKYNPAKQPCMEENEDCFALNRMGNCNVLTETEFCGGCPFYKPLEVFEQECVVSYEHLVVRGRSDLIAKYGLRDQGLCGSWTVERKKYR